MIDFKIRTIQENDSGKVVSYAIYKGDITTEDEQDFETGKIVPVTRYRRSSLLKTGTIVVGKDEDILLKMKGLISSEAVKRKEEVINQQK